jgi:L-lactate dehydrogenase complex protein LldG
MSGDREAMLARIRASLGVAYLPGAPPALEPWAVERPEERPAARAARFSAALTAVGGEVLAAGSAAEAQRLVGDLARQAGEGGVLMWPDAELPLPLEATVREAGHVPVVPRVRVPREARRADVAALDAPSLGITGALAGLADTGSLAVCSGPQRPMVVSLTPLTHLALLPVARLLPDMATFMRVHQATALAVAGRNLVFITGPSRTADIEMVITRGVHGPKRLVVILIEDETPGSASA